MAKPRATRTVMAAGDVDEQQVVQEIMGKSKGKPATKAWSKAKASGARKADERRRPASTHETRVTQTRSAEPVHEMADEPWVQPASLPEIPARAGYKQRWVRVSIDGREDNTNVTRKMREGFRPRPAETVPRSLPVPKLSHGQFAGAIGIEGMVLMEIPEKRNAVRNAFYAQKNKRQLMAINHELAQASRHGSAAFGPIVKEERSTPVREVPISSEE